MSVNWAMSAEAEAQWRIQEERFAMPTAGEGPRDFARLLAPEFREFSASGRIRDAAAMIDAVLRDDRSGVLLEQFAARVIADATVLVTYVSRSVAAVGSKAPVLRSSLWCLRQGRWQLVFHQGTRMPVEASE